MSNSFAIKEVLDYTVEKYKADGRGDVLFSVDYAGQSNINTTAERLPIRGGQGNYKIMDLDHTKDCEYASVLPLVDIKALAAKLGKDVTEGAVKTPFDKVFVVGEGNKIELPEHVTPIVDSLKVYKVEFERDIDVELEAGESTTEEGTYAIAEQVITFNATSCPVGSKVLVSCNYLSGENAQNIKITASDFPQFITIRGRGLVNDDQEGLIIPVTFTIHKAKVRPEFELSMAGDAATELDFTCDCYTILNADGEREFVDIVKLNDESY